MPAAKDLADNFKSISRFQLSPSVQAGIVHLSSLDLFQKGDHRAGAGAGGGIGMNKTFLSWKHDILEDSERKSDSELLSG